VAHICLRYPWRVSGLEQTKVAMDKEKPCHVDNTALCYSNYYSLSTTYGFEYQQCILSVSYQRQMVRCSTPQALRTLPHPQFHSIIFYVRFASMKAVCWSEIQKLTVEVVHTIIQFVVSFNDTVFSCSAVSTPPVLFLNM
jgi:hypothetical protein